MNTGNGDANDMFRSERGYGFRVRIDFFDSRDGVAAASDDNLKATKFKFKLIQQHSTASVGKLHGASGDTVLYLQLHAGE